MEDTKNIYDIIDTALKIGLGGIIGWGTSYTMQKLKYKNDRNGLLFDRKYETYESAIDEIEIYIDHLLKLFSYINGVKKANKPTGETLDLISENRVELKKRNEKLVDSRYVKRLAVSKFNLLSADKIIVVLEKIARIEREFQEDVVFSSNSILLDRLKQLEINKELLIIELREEMANFYKVINI